MVKVSRSLLAVFAAALLCASTGFAQTDEVPLVTRTFALENARIIQAPGRVIERGTVVVRDGLLLAVGPNVAVPYDAERIAADSLVIYAGFIDGLSHAGVPRPKEDNDREGTDVPSNPPNDVAGIQPERDVRALLAPDDKSVTDLREAGFGAAHVVPYGRMLPGTGAVVLLSGAAPGAMVLRGEAALFAQIEGARGVYPATPMGVMAKFRELYREADRRHGIETRYAENPAAMARPAYDAVHYAFFPVLDGERPVFFYAEDALDTRRALRLRDDLGFPLILGGLAQGFEVTDALGGVPLFVTLDLPEAPKATAKLKADSVAALLDAFDPELQAATHRDLQAEQRNLQARQLMSRDAYLANAAALHNAGFPFGFTTIDVKPGDIHKNLRLMIEHGLPEDVALAALTTNAARLLGLDRQLGTVEPGKIANLVVTTAPYFTEDAKIKYVFVDGVKYEYETKAKKKPTGEPVNPAGVWTLEINAGGPIGGTLTLTGSPDALEGNITLDIAPGTFALSDIDYEGNVLSGSFTVPEVGAVTMELTFTADEVTGSADSSQGPASITGTRTSGPDR